MDKYFRHIEDNFLTLEEAQGFINLAESIGFEEAKIKVRGEGEVMDKNFRDNDRVVYENQQLAQQLWPLISPFIPSEVDEYKAIGLNEKFRFYRYKDGQQFKVHPDGAFKRNEFEHSKITLIIYLNEEFEGGKTIFVNPFQEIEPKTGKLLLFSHAQLHKGEEVPEGTKYVLRSDIMYRREPTPEEIESIGSNEEEEIYLGTLKTLFGEKHDEEGNEKATYDKLMELAREWNSKGYMIATGKISENKAHELWAIKKQANIDNE